MDKDLSLWRALALQQQAHCYAAFGREPLWQGNPLSDPAGLQSELSRVISTSRRGFDVVDTSASVKRVTSMDKLAYKLYRKVAHRFPGDLILRVTFVIAHAANCKSEVIPVFSIARAAGASEEVFLDTHCRVYCDWRDFLHANRVSRLHVCYPTNGRYTMNAKAHLMLQFGISSRYTPARRFLRMLDALVNGFALIGLLLFMVTQYVPFMLGLNISCAVFLAIVLLYNITRGLYWFYDIRKHS